MAYYEDRYDDIYDEKLAALKDELKTSDAVIIGAGAGLSTAAGFTYSGGRLQRYFGDFAEKYGFRDMYSGGFYPFETLEEQWAYWSRYIYVNRYLNPVLPAYDQLYELVKDKDYFVLTTNVDHCFQKAGFDKKRLFYTQGDYGLWQCSKPCHNKTYDNYEIVASMIMSQGYAINTDGRLLAPENEDGSVDFSRLKMKISSELIPYCPVCGEPMSMNLRADDTFVEDDGWHAAAERYNEYLETHRNRKVLFLELGVGMNTPGIIKYNFWRMADGWINVRYACINLTDTAVPDVLKKKSICIDRDIRDVLEDLEYLFETDDEPAPAEEPEKVNQGQGEDGSAEEAETVKETPSEGAAKQTENEILSDTQPQK